MKGDLLGKGERGVERGGRSHGQEAAGPNAEKVLQKHGGLYQEGKKKGLERGKT